MSVRVMLPVNTMLMTKDGRSIGNALIVGSYNSTYIVKTDYGNRLDLSRREIERYFHISKVARFTHKYFVKDAE